MCQNFENGSKFWKWVKFLKISQNFENGSIFWKRVNNFKMGQKVGNVSKLWKWIKILKMGQNLEKGSIFWKWVKNLKTCQKIWKWVKILEMGQNFENKAIFWKWGKKKLKVRVICAWNARQVRVNLVPESARHLQMTRTRQMRVKCASSARESCAGIRASFTNDAYASNARHLCTRTRSLPEAQMFKDQFWPFPLEQAYKGTF